MKIKTLLIFNTLLIGFHFYSPKEFAPIEFYKLRTVSHLSNDLCEGSLGENIFEDGDFGTGSIVDLPSDPNNYAPGYLYQPSPPPNDGYYTITNNTSAWGFFASGWINIGDNSSDPNGYMMVVNASYDPDLFYEETIDGLCENTLYQFSADVINLIADGGGIKPNLDFLINGQSQYSTGDIVGDGQWNTYGFTFTTEPGMTSLTLAIGNNAPGGGGNDLALDNISFQACGPEVTIENSNPVICDGETTSLVTYIFGSQYPDPYYQWELSTDNGATWTSVFGQNASNLILDTPINGYQYRLRMSNSLVNLDNVKCSVLSNVIEITISSNLFTIYDTLCQGLTLEVGSSVYSETGVYLDSLIGISGCDSIVTTNLEVVAEMGIVGIYDLISPACSDDGNGTIIIDDVLNGSGIYEYSLDNGPFQSVPYFENLDYGSYTISIQDHYGCIGIEQVDLIESLALSVNLGEDISIALGCETSLQPVLNTIVDSYNWQPSTGLSCIDCLSPTLTPIETETYHLIVTDLNGCTKSDSITVFVDKTRNVFIPNAFSPNGDGYNDDFIINGGKEVESIVQIKIFDRWGGLVFSQNNFSPNELDASWNGFVDGDEANIGVYIYMVEILFKDGIIERFSGDVTLMK